MHIHKCKKSHRKLQQRLAKSLAKLKFDYLVSLFITTFCKSNIMSLTAEYKDDVLETKDKEEPWTADRTEQHKSFLMQQPTVF